MTGQDWSNKNRHFIALTLASADLSARFWIAFYNSDTPLKATIPSTYKHLNTLYQTPGMSISDNHLCCAYRGVFIGQLG